MNFHAATQAIADVRALLGYIAEPHAPVVVFGISLGGYVAASVAALEPTIAGVILGIPVVDIADLMRTHAPPRFVRHPAFGRFCTLAGRLDSVTSPLGLPIPTTEVRRIWAGRADRLVQPQHVARLVAHWGGPEVCWYTGGHVGFLTAPAVHGHIAQALVDSGVAEIERGTLRAVADTASVVTAQQRLRHG
jgi:pimeloyl-ACP methyl ester carboxylesterase